MDCPRDGPWVAGTSEISYVSCPLWQISVSRQRIRGMRLVFMEICRKEIPLRHPSLFCFFFPPAFFTRLILFPGGPSLSVPPYEYYVLRTEGNADKGAP